MATTTLPTAVAGQALKEAPEVLGRKAKPVKWWALFGCICLGLTAVSWSRWFFGGHAHAVPAGPTPIPTWQLVGLRANEVVAVVGCVIVIYLVLWRPWRRERRLTFDGALVIGIFGTWMFLDPLISYSQFWYTYNAKLVNLGCPQCYLPGWQSNASTFPDPLLYGAGFYIMGFFPVAVVVSIMMRKAKQRWPQLGTFGLLAVAFVASFVADVLIEIPYVRIGTYTIGGSHRGWTLFHGKYYQFPIYEAIFASLWFVGLGAIRYFRNDRGESVAERGIDEVRASPAQRAGLRILAMVGICSAAALLYNLPVYFVSLHSDAWPKDVTTRSYFGVCGPMTDHACPGPRVPITGGPKSAHATPDGTMVAPAGLPVQGPVRVK